MQCFIKKVEEGKSQQKKKERKKEDYMTFRGPCIVMYSYNERQRDALFLKFI